MENDKFPSNQQKVAGSIVSMKVSENRNRINLTVQTPGESNKYIKVLIAGEDRVNNFVASYDEAKKTFDKVNVALTGIANFQENKTPEGVTHKNNTLIVIDSLEKESDSFKMPKNQSELEAFSKQYHSRSEEINQVKLMGKVCNNPTFNVSGEKQNEFANFLLSHLYTDKQNNVKEMTANVIVPTKLLENFKASGFSSENGKGTTIKISATVQPRTYVDKSGNNVYTFNLVAKSLVPMIKQEQVKDSAKVEKNEQKTNNAASNEKKEKPEKTRGKNM